MPRHSDPFDALAHPMRRAILEMLRDRPGLTPTVIAEAFPLVSRPAVAKHLAVLRSAGMVQSESHGREAFYNLNPGPLRDVYERWLRQFEPLWEESLTNLKRAAERSERSDGDETGAGPSPSSESRD